MVPGRRPRTAEPPRRRCGRAARRIYDPIVGAAEISLPATLRSVSDARRFVRQTLREVHGDAAEWAASQVVSELVTNAVLHARTACRVSLSVTGELVRLEVEDHAPQNPRERSYGVLATTGRGLRLVAALARSWGSYPVAGGKVVWCELAADRDGHGVDSYTDPEVFFGAMDATVSDPGAPDRRGCQLRAG